MVSFFFLPKDRELKDRRLLKDLRRCLGSSFSMGSGGGGDASTRGRVEGADFEVSSCGRARVNDAWLPFWIFIREREVCLLPSFVTA